ncbi:MAG: transglycosylase domain-containing protein, partial [Nitriliruptoraceae bacterium]
MSPAKTRTTKSAKATQQTRTRRRWMWALLIIPATILGAGGLLAFYLIFSAIPLPDDIASDASVVYDYTGTPVGSLAEERSRMDLSLDELPDHLIEAVLAAEDRRFYEHRGVSFTGILRAVFTNVRAGSVQQGGSTITQQYIKNAMLSPDQTYSRKVEEAALAIKLEQRYDKTTILTFYLNTIYWGRGAYGIEAAARTYFGVTATELTVNQAATLAGIIAAPEAYDPAEQPERAEGRRQYVIGGMVDTGALDEPEATRLVAAGLPNVTPRAGLDRGPNAYYLDAVRRELSAVISFDDGRLFRGLRIYTGLDVNLQATAQETLADAIAEGPSDTGAIVSIDPLNGEVRALVGGPDGTVQPLNTALRSMRQAGSTFKAFTLQAFLEAGYSPNSVFPAPSQLSIGDATIRNYGGSGSFSQTVTEATVRSTNTVYVSMQELIGRESVIDAARRSGLPLTKRDEAFPTDRDEGDTMRPFAGLTLGQDVFSPLELTAAYTTYAADGFAITPQLVVRVEDAQGRVLYTPEVTEQQVMEVNVARTVTALLQRSVAQGTGRNAQLADRPVAGKTGTTNDARDVWFVGYVPQLVTGVWLGNLDNTPLGGSATGGGLAAPVWATYMGEAVKDLPVESFPRPTDMGTVVGALTECPEGYTFMSPDDPALQDDDAEVLNGYLNSDGEVCAKEPPPQCPEGYTFTAEPPGGFADNVEVLDEPVDEEGRVCTRVVDEPKDPTEPAPEPEEEP